MRLQFGVVGMVIAAVALLGMPAGTARADLIGTQVTGSLKFGSDPNNYFDPMNGFVPSGFLNRTSGTTVTIAEPAVEFGFNDTANRYTANFTGTQLIITDSVFLGGPNSPVHMTFTDPAFAGFDFSRTSDNFPGGATSSLSGTTLTIEIQGASVSTGQTFQAIFGHAANNTVPEPTSLALFGLGAVAVAGWCRWKRRR